MTARRLARLPVEATQVGGETAHRFFRSELRIERKSGNTDVVTQGDHVAQAAVGDRIRDTFPDATLVGEERTCPTTIPEQGRCWIADPVDGTNNFIRGNRVWACSVACVESEEPVAAATGMPATGDQYIGTAHEVIRHGSPVTVRAHRFGDLHRRAHAVVGIRPSRGIRRGDRGDRPSVW